VLRPRGRPWFDVETANASFGQGISVSTVQLAVAMAVTSGARGLEAVVVLGDAAVVDEHDLSVVRDLAGAGVPVHLAAPDGTVVASVAS
jgi:hypothetical protein